MSTDRLQGNPDAIRALAKQLTELGLSVNEGAAKFYGRLGQAGTSGDWSDRNYKKYCERYEDSGRALQKILKEWSEQATILQKFAEEYERLHRMGG